MLFFNFECINPTSAWLLIGAFHTKQQRNKIKTDKKIHVLHTVIGELGAAILLRTFCQESALSEKMVLTVHFQVVPGENSEYTDRAMEINRWRHWLELCRSNHIQPWKTQKWIPNTQEHLIFIIWEFHQLSMTKSQQQCCLNFLKNKTKNRHSFVPFFDANLNLSNDVRGRTFLSWEK